jgi:hypothetical protein
MKSRGINKSRRSTELTGAIRVIPFAQSVQDNRGQPTFLRVIRLDL